MLSGIVWFMSTVLIHATSGKWLFILANQFNIRNKLVYKLVQSIEDLSYYA